MAANKRFWEVDALRGLAISAMIAFHFLFDLKYFAGTNLLSAELWRFLPSIIGSTFIFLAGVALTFSKSNPRERGAKIFSWGLAITALTFIAFPQAVIWFGILHFIGLSILLAQPFLKRFALAGAVGAFALTALTAGMNAELSPLLLLGIRPTLFYTFDYYPLLPWFGVLLLGIVAGHRLYRARKRRFALPDLSAKPIVKQLSWMGQRSLKIYLLHQPVLVGLILLLSMQL